MHECSGHKFGWKGKGFLETSGGIEAAVGGPTKEQGINTRELRCVVH